MAPLTNEELYAQQLQHLNLGHALYQPEHEEEVQIGDVGYIYRGRFERVANIFSSAQGLPCLNMSETERVECLPDLPKGALSSKSIEVEVEEGETEFGDPGIRIRLTCKSDRGVSLITKYRSKVERAKQPMLMQRFFDDNILTWFDYAKCDEQYCVKDLKDFVLVTGRVMTGDWHIGIFDRGRKNMDFVWSTSMGHGVLLGSDLQRYLPIHNGPRRNVATEGKEPHLDQCIFLTYRGCDPFVTEDPYQFYSLSWPSLRTRKGRAAHTFATILIQIYRHLLLRLPSIYFSRVSKSLEEAGVTRREMQRMIVNYAAGKEFPMDLGPNTDSSAVSRFKSNWEGFIDSVMREWKTLNIVSTLLLSAILTMFQIGDAAQQVVTRSASLISLICATWSIIYGGIYIMRFGTMRSMHRAANWALEAQKPEAQNSKTHVFWNVWVLLALPAVWLTWSMVAFFTAIISFVWTAGSSDDNPQPPAARVFLVPRVLITVLFILGLVYFFLVVYTISNYSKPRLSDVDFDISHPSMPEGVAMEGVSHGLTSPVSGPIADDMTTAPASITEHASARTDSTSSRVDVEKDDTQNSEDIGFK